MVIVEWLPPVFTLTHKLFVMVFFSPLFTWEGQGGRVLGVVLVGTWYFSHSQLPQHVSPGSRTASILSFCCSEYNPIHFSGQFFHGSCLHHTVKTVIMCSTLFFELCSRTGFCLGHSCTHLQLSLCLSPDSTRYWLGLLWYSSSNTSFPHHCSLFHFCLSDTLHHLTLWLFSVRYFQTFCPKSSF